MAKLWNAEGLAEGIIVRNYKDLNESLDMDVKELFPSWDSFEDVQKQCIVNGLKQKIDDSIARSKEEKLTEKEKFEVQSELWNRISVERSWNSGVGVGKTKEPSRTVRALTPGIILLAEHGVDAEMIAKSLVMKVEDVQKIVDNHLEE